MGWLDPPSYYDLYREGNYRYLEPKLMVEEYLGEDVRYPPTDYKVFCFSGRAKFIQVDVDRFGQHMQAYFDIHWNRVGVRVAAPTPEGSLVKPRTLSEMIEVSQRLAQAFSFVRVDCYSVGAEVRIGELTHCPNGANKPVIPRKGELELGEHFRDIHSGRR